AGVSNRVTKSLERDAYRFAGRVELATRSVLANEQDRGERQNQKDHRCRLERLLLVSFANDGPGKEQKPYDDSEVSRGNGDTGHRPPQSRRCDLCKQRIKLGKCKRRSCRAHTCKRQNRKRAKRADIRTEYAD